MALQLPDHISLLQHLLYSHGGVRQQFVSDGLSLLGEGGNSRIAQDTACDLGVVVESRLSLSGLVATICLGGCYQFRQLQPSVPSLSEDARRILAYSDLHFLSPGLLQRCFLVSPMV